MVDSPRMLAERPELPLIMLYRFLHTSIRFLVRCYLLTELVIGLDKGFSVGHRIVVEVRMPLEMSIFLSI